MWRPARFCIQCPHASLQPNSSTFLCWQTLYFSLSWEKQLIGFLSGVDLCGDRVEWDKWQEEGWPWWPDGHDDVNLVFLQTFHWGKGNDRPAVVGKSESAFEVLYWGHLGSPIKYFMPIHDHWWSFGAGQIGSVSWTSTIHCRATWLKRVDQLAEKKERRSPMTCSLSKV